MNATPGSNADSIPRDPVPTLAERMAKFDALEARLAEQQETIHMLEGCVLQLAWQAGVILQPSAWAGMPIKPRKPVMINYMGAPEPTRASFTKIVPVGLDK